MDTKRFLFCSLDAALVADLAWQVHREGHDVRYYIERDEDLTNSRNAAIVFESESRTGIHIEDAKTVDGQWRVAGENGMPLVVTGTGETMQRAREQCYERVEDIVIPNLYYRDDIGERWIGGDGDRLQAWGYLGPGGP